MPIARKLEQYYPTLELEWAAKDAIFNRRMEIATIVICAALIFAAGLGVGWFIWGS